MSAGTTIRDGRSQLLCDAQELAEELDRWDLNRTQETPEQRRHWATLAADVADAVDKLEYDEE